ncbi:hypothetical protein VCHENC02_0661B, partial [Vibrio harveyi]
ICINPHV